MTPPDDLVAQAERLARELWGDDSWLFTQESEPGIGYPLVDHCWCASAHRSHVDDDLVSVSVNYLPTQEAALRTLCAGLQEALRAAADADQVAMATCGDEGVDAQGSEVEEEPATCDCPGVAGSDYHDSGCWHGGTR